MCFLYQTYKLKLSNLERKLFIGMVCKKMGEEVDLNTLSFLCKHFFGICHPLIIDFAGHPANV